jgi:TRAP-type C4-dicarboxylate transport system permease small subunit
VSDERHSEAPCASSPSWLDRGLGLLSLAGYVLSSVYGDPYDYLWSCHVGLLLLALALWLPGQRPAGVTFLWVVFGFALWGLDALNGLTLDGMTLSIHFGGLALACYLLWRRGWPQTWVAWVVILGNLALQHLCRFVTPPELNVNLAWGIRAGWEGNFDSYWWPYWTLIVCGGAAALVVVEAFARWVSRRLHDGADSRQISTAAETA